MDLIIYHPLINLNRIPPFSVFAIVNSSVVTFFFSLLFYSRYFVDTLGHNDSSRPQSGGTTVLVVETQSEDDVHQHAGTRLTLQSSGVITSTAYTHS